MLRSNAIHGRRFQVGQAVLVAKDFDRNTATRRTKFSMVFDTAATVEAVNVGGDANMYLLRSGNGDSIVAHVRRLKLRFGVATAAATASAADTADVLVEPDALDAAADNDNA